MLPNSRHPSNTLAHKEEALHAHVVAASLSLALSMASTCSGAATPGMIAPLSYLPEECA
jgi:hypothetical protein